MPKAIPDERGFKFRFFSNESHEPPHVHVFKGNGDFPKAKWWLLPKPELEYSDGFTVQEHRIIEEIIQTRYKDMVKKWKEHFKH
ncbi:MAG: hypothetical protein K0S33_3169 [Bacteroidetes bacterium]|jgi:hypothetical protein|nr:hypothetical protein [Bacteroidota bacterium]